MNAELHSFVRESLARRVPRPAIAAALRAANWRPEEIEAALAGYDEQDFPIPVPRRRPYVSAREAFLHLVLFATLYTTAFNVGLVLFRLVDLWLPDASARWETARMAIQSIRGAVAGLVIAFPIFLVLSRTIGREMEREPEKRGSKIRKWLTYLTLFAAAMVIIGDLTFLVARFLSGELPVRVLLKTLIVLAIAGTVFSHYLAELRRDEREGATPGRELRVPPRLTAVAVFAVIVAGLVASGSPGSERRRQLDGQRVEDLRRISGQVESWASRHRRLPTTLEELMNDPEAAGARFHDPVSRSVYEYRVLDSLSYELCATFVAADSISGEDGPGPAPRFWRHASGRQCYRLSVPPRVLSGMPPDLYREGRP